MSTSSTQDVSTSLSQQPRDPITLRSMLIGLGLVGAMSALAPYNDFVVENGFLIGGYLPTFLVFCLFALVMLNAVLYRVARSQAFSTTELATITLMLLAGSSVPCQGLLRSFIPALVHPFQFAVTNEDFRKAFRSMGLPPWMYPTEMLDTAQASPIVSWFYARVPEGEQIPYAAWIKPIGFWSIFFVSAFLSLVGSAMIMYPQWARNERLAFPLAQVQLAMIEPPARGKGLNDLFSSRSFWIALILVVWIHSMNALNQHFPRQVPKIPLSYDLTNIFSEEPWRFFGAAIKANRLMFLYVGTAFFIQARMSFSIWFIHIVFNTVLVIMASRARLELSGDAKMDQHLGACLVMMAGMLWVGRHYYWQVVRRPLQHHPFALLCLLIGLVGMIAWLSLLQVSLWVALLIIIMMMVSHITTARIVAETGLPIVRTYPYPLQVISRAKTSWLSVKDVYLGGVFGTNGATLARESVAAFSQQAENVFENATNDTGRKVKIGLLITLTLLVAFVIGVWAHLHAYYSYATPISSRTKSTIINPMGAGLDGFNFNTQNAVVDFQRGGFRTPNYSPYVQLSIGVGITSFLMLMSLRFANWPLLAVGFVLAPTWFAEQAWFSVMMGWIAKVLIVRFGGASMFKKVRPLFMGLIVGEVLAGAIWLIVNIILAQKGLDYYPVQLIPS